MHFVYLDFECWMSRTVKLSKMTLRQYLAATHITGVSFACDDGEIQYLAADANGTLPVEFVENLTAAALDPSVTFVAHNAAFDIRVARLLLGVPQPQHVHCTIELAHAAFPNQPGGYKLKKLAETLGLSAPKLDLDLSKRHTPEQLEEYCKRDTQLCREIHRLCLPRLPARELEIAELCNAVRELHFVVRPEKVARAIDTFSTVAAESVIDAMGYLDRDGTQIAETKLAFGWVREPGTLGDDDPGQPKSVRPEKLKALLLDRLGFDTKTISYKKINPSHLAANANAASALQGTSRANKALSHKRRVAVFSTSAEVDAELGFFRAHTGRFSSPSTGRGLNLHNLPKRDKAVAQPVREMFELPAGLCLVRADEANVEYRCLREGTPVLTDSGWKPIESILDVDRVWDGIEFVQHSGVVCNGSREVIDVHGVWMTPDHPVLSKAGWVPAATAATSACRDLVLSSVDGFAPERRTLTEPAGTTSVSCARVAGRLRSRTPIYCAASVENAGPAQRNDVGGKRRSSKTTDSERSGSTVTNAFVRPVSTKHIRRGVGTAVARSDSRTICAIETPSWRTSSPSPAGTTSRSRSIDETTSAGTSAEICAASHARFNARTGAACTTPSSEPHIARVYDVLDCGPRARFVVHGGLIVHNCEGWMTRCAHTEKLFLADLLADPYSEFGYAVTGHRVTKEDPARQVYKAAVLALGFGMGIGTWMSQLLLLISDKANEVTLDDLEQIVIEQEWAPVTDRWALAQQTKIHAPTPVLTVAFYMRKMFHDVHPEFSIFGKWLMHVVERVSSAIDPESAIEQCYNRADAPDRSRLDLSIDPGLSGRTLRASCGPWTQTVAWRDIGLHDTKLGFCLSSVQAGNKAYRKLTPSILIENVIQSLARNSICAAKLELKRRGWNYLLSVHDELMIVCERSRAAVLAARADLLDVLGPANALGWDWAAVVNPDEINVSQSLYEKDMGTLLVPIGEKIVKGKPKPVYPASSVWWQRLESGEESLLDVLP